MEKKDKFVSKFASYQLVVKSGYKKEVEGEIIPIAGKRIQFKNFEYVAQNEAEEKFLNSQLESGNNNFWKVSAKEMVVAEEHAKRIAELNKEYAEKISLIQDISRDGDKIQKETPSLTSGTTNVDDVNRIAGGGNIKPTNEELEELEEKRDELSKKEAELQTKEQELINDSTKLEEAQKAFLEDQEKLEIDKKEVEEIKQDLENKVAEQGESDDRVIGPDSGDELEEDAPAIIESEETVK